jgi:hypothetical protein
VVDIVGAGAEEVTQKASCGDRVKALVPYGLPYQLIADIINVRRLLL